MGFFHQFLLICIFLFMLFFWVCKFNQCDFLVSKCILLSPYFCFDISVIKTCSSVLNFIWLMIWLGHRLQKHWQRYFFACFCQSSNSWKIIELIITYILVLERKKKKKNRKGKGKRREKWGREEEYEKENEWEKKIWPMLRPTAHRLSRLSKCCRSDALIHSGKKTTKSKGASERKLSG